MFVSANNADVAFAVYTWQLTGLILVKIVIFTVRILSNYIVEYSIGLDAFCRHGSNNITSVYGSESRTWQIMLVSNWM